MVPHAGLIDVTTKKAVNWATPLLWEVDHLILQLSRQSRLTEKLVLARKMWRIIMIQKAEGSAYKNLGIRNSLAIRETIQAILPSKEVSKPPFE